MSSMRSLAGIDVPEEVEYFKDIMAPTCTKFDINHLHRMPRTTPSYITTLSYTSIFTGNL